MKTVIYFFVFSVVVYKIPESFGQTEPAECLLPADPGPCDAIYERYFYNSTSCECEIFIYGGCGGNRNNFETLQECEKECEPVDCSLPAEPGPCKAAIKRYFYNNTSGDCEIFTYGGCGGNSNNFETLQECESKCDNNTF